MRNRYYSHALLLAFCCCHWPSYAQDEITKWEPAICQLELLDQQERDPENAILFVGSSSVRLWDTMEQDMAPYSTIRRGYGGAKFSDLDYYVDRLVVSHKCRAIVIFVANDISGKETDSSPQEVVQLVASVTKKIRTIHPETPIFFVEITPTQSRWKAWRKIRELNSRIAEFCSDHDRVHFISTVSHYLDDTTDEPIAGYFGEDQLHQNSEGYKVWGTIIKSRLDQVLGSYSPKKCPSMPHLEVN